MSEVIDMSVVEELLALCEDGDSELLVDLIEMFLSDGPSRVQGVVDGLRDGDFEKVEQSAHSLKGSAGNLGAQQVQHISEALQLASRQADEPAIRRLAPQLQERYSEAEQALRELLSRYS